MENYRSMSWVSWASWARVVRVVPFLVVLKLLWALHEPSRLYFGSLVAQRRMAFLSSGNSAHFVRCVKYKAAIMNLREIVFCQGWVQDLFPNVCHKYFTLPQILYSSSQMMPCEGGITWERCKLGQVGNCRDTLHSTCSTGREMRLYKINICKWCVQIGDARVPRLEDWEINGLRGANLLWSRETSSNVFPSWSTDQHYPDIAWKVST